MILENAGFDNFFQEEAGKFAADGFIPARVILEYPGSYRLLSEHGEMTGEVSGKMNYTATGRADLPAVGDWVMIQPYDNNEKAIIHALLPRKTLLRRKNPGRHTEEQIIAANIDCVFIVQGLDLNFNIRRLERYLLVAAESGASLAVLLTKKDLSPETVEEKVKAAKNAAPEIPVMALSSIEGDGLDAVRSLIKDGLTFCLIGSSGAGKSTLINALAGREIMASAEVRQADSRGRHTTTVRQTVFLDGGGILIDTPGMRELGVWEEAEEGSAVFSEIDALARGCRFENCSHISEPGCAVRQAVENGELDSGRYESFVKLSKELEYISEKKEDSLRRKNREKQLSRQLKNYQKLKDRQIT